MTAGRYPGVPIAAAVVAAWGAHLVYALERVPADPASPWTVAHALLQAYLFTGLFITAHDAMHGSVARRPRLNSAIGAICAFLFAGLSYRRLLANHALHHRYPATGRDPDFFARSQHPLPWWAVFMWRYATLPQLAVMAIAYNLLALRYDEASIISFWVAPALLASVQLFLFGTWIPHRLPHDASMLPDNARTMRRNHALAMLACWFFGYHAEHHASPGTPWWRLHRLKDAGVSHPPPASV